MAKGKTKQEDLAQFNYRLPGEPETYGMESKEDPKADLKRRRSEIADEEDAAKHRREDSLKAAEGGRGLSPNKGQSDPKTQKEVDDMNTWSEAR